MLKHENQTPVMSSQIYEARGIPGTPGGGQAGPARQTMGLRLQIGGFVLIIALLGLDAYVGFHGAAAIRQELTASDESQSANAALINEALQAQQTLSALQSRLSGSFDDTGRARSKAAVETIKQSLRQIFARTSPDGPDAAAWRDTENTSRALTMEMGRVLDLPAGSPQDLTHVQNAYNQFASATANLVQASHAWSGAARRQIYATTSHESVEDRLLLSGCLIVVCMFLWIAARTHGLLKEQAEELGRVSWQLLEKQELLARRLSHELHDELGQSLTALKTNFSRHASSSCVDLSWMEDCTQLLKDSIRNAHEISQLLRPTVLDDFGLDSAVAWLCERFEERNGIKVRYLADFHDRLEEQTETHVFRIAQEALTNIARHAGASFVRVTLRRETGRVSLEVSDNGVGIPSPKEMLRSSFGLTGMKARARSLQGEMQITSAPGRGTTILVTFPLRDTSGNTSGDHPDRQTG